MAAMLAASGLLPELVSTGSLVEECESSELEGGDVEAVDELLCGVVVGLGILGALAGSGTELGELLVIAGDGDGAVGGCAIVVVVSVAAAVAATGFGGKGGTDPASFLIPSANFDEGVGTGGKPGWSVGGGGPGSSKVRYITGSCGCVSTFFFLVGTECVKRKHGNVHSSGSSKPSLSSFVEAPQKLRHFVNTEPI